ncbi:NrfD/PsrC family molybdoenzyme membrane anchor subunit [Actinomadura alba]|uniref:Polysulfide reductase NrfD n=1 Tax=Actinomadura alba TaxID=406431 RepID=A0ABR7M1T9_9ACTN|nr:NrfD/PsrC family molybdoenzyme membrane anchor subunit [Actinomadura alba]MBC6471079.1 polysulfide reductase NrfD [Actinomadura alba]
MNGPPRDREPTAGGSGVGADDRAGPPRDAIPGSTGDRGRRRPGGRGERRMVPGAEFTSYYGLPILNGPVWQARDIAGYFFLGGLAGASSVLAAGAVLTGRPQLAYGAKIGATGAIALAAVALVHDLGRPERFLNMLRVAKPTSPMSVGSWLLTGYGPLAGAAAASAVTGRLPGLGLASTLGAAAVGPAIAGYTAALICDTAVPAWHDAYREMPFVFVGSAAAAAGGLGLVTAPIEQTPPARALALAGTAAELVSVELMERRLGMVAEPYRRGRSGRLMTAARLLACAGVAGAYLGRRSRALSALSGTALLAASAATRFGVFAAGVASAADPKYTVVPQRERLRRRAEQAAEAQAGPGTTR